MTIKEGKIPGFKVRNNNTDTTKKNGYQKKDIFYGSRVCSTSGYFQPYDTSSWLAELQGLLWLEVQELSGHGGGCHRHIPLFTCRAVLQASLSLKTACRRDGEEKRRLVCLRLRKIKKEKKKKDASRRNFSYYLYIIDTFCYSIQFRQIKMIIKML